MADTTTITCTDKRESGAAGNYSFGSTYVRTFTFPVLNSATGYGTTDILNLITIPANTGILAIYTKSSVSQTADLAFNLTGAAAFTAVAVVGTTFTEHNMAIADRDLAVTGASDTVLQAVIGTATMNAGTITCSVVCVALGTEVAAYTTYTV